MSPAPHDAILVFGAGCIGRGLWGELASQAGRPAVFVEAEPGLAADLRRAGGYTVRLTGRAESATRVSQYRVLSPREPAGLAEAIGACAFAATAVGGEHLAEVAPLLADGLRARGRRLNILVGENWPRADGVLADALLASGADARTFACVPCSVERMARRVPDSLDIVAESLESLVYDAGKWAGAPPDLPGLIPVDDLRACYARKLFTNNAGHAVLAYEGFLAGHALLWEAHRDPAIRARVEALLGPAAEMLAREYGLPRESLRDHARILLDYRFANRALADTVRRVARDPLRKLGPEERLVGLLRRLQKHGLPIEPACRTIAAALCYDDPDDDACARLRAMLEVGGPGSVLRDVCGIQPDEEAYTICLEQWPGHRRSMP
jgi:mannitol-1-phosphate 5-dehydrogenase